MVILDTDLIVGVFRNDKDAMEKINNLQNLGVKMETTAINTFELFEGAFKSKTKDDSLIFVLNFLSNLETVLPFDIVASRMAGKIMSELKQKGITLDQSDVMISAIAIKDEKVIVSRNTKHFRRIEGLKLQTW